MSDRFFIGFGEELIKIAQSQSLPQFKAQQEARRRSAMSAAVSKLPGMGSISSSKQKSLAGAVYGGIAPKSPSAGEKLLQRMREQRSHAQGARILRDIGMKPVAETGRVRLPKPKPEVIPAAPGPPMTEQRKKLLAESKKEDLSARKLVGRYIKRKRSKSRPINEGRSYLPGTGPQKSYFFGLPQSASTSAGQEMFQQVERGPAAAAARRRQMAEIEASRRRRAAETEFRKIQTPGPYRAMGANTQPYPKTTI